MSGFEAPNDVSLRKASLLSTPGSRSATSPTYDYESARRQQQNYPTLTHAYRTTSALPLPPTSPPVSPYPREDSGRDMSHHQNKLKDVAMDFTIHRRSPGPSDDTVSEHGDSFRSRTSRLHYGQSSTGGSSYHDSLRRGATTPFRSPPGEPFPENGVRRGGSHEIGKDLRDSQGYKDTLRYKDPKPNAIVRFQCRNLPQFKAVSTKDRYVSITFNDVQQQTLVMQTEWISDILNPRFESTLELRDLEPYYNNRSSASLSSRYSSPPDTLSPSQFMICIYRGQHILAHTEKISYSVLLSLHTTGEEPERHIIFPLKNWHDENLDRRLREIRSEVVLSVSSGSPSESTGGRGGGGGSGDLRSPPLKLLTDPYHLEKRSDVIYPTGIASPPTSYRPTDISFSSSIGSPELDVKFKADIYVNSGSKSLRSGGGGGGGTRREFGGGYGGSGGGSLNSSPSHSLLYTPPPASYEDPYQRSPPIPKPPPSVMSDHHSEYGSHSPHRGATNRKFTYYHSNSGPSSNPSRSQFTLPNDSSPVSPPQQQPASYPSTTYASTTSSGSRSTTRLPASPSRIPRNDYSSSDQRPLTKDGGGYAFRLRRKVLESTGGDESGEEDRDSGEEIEDVRMYVEESDTSPTLLVWTRDPELESRPKEERSVPLYRLTRMHGSKQDGAFSIVYKQKRRDHTTDNPDDWQWERIMLKLQARNSAVRNYWLKSLHPLVMKERNIQKQKQYYRSGGGSAHRGSSGTSFDEASILDDQDDGLGSGLGGVGSPPFDFNIKELSISGSTTVSSSEMRKIPSREQLYPSSKSRHERGGGSGGSERYESSTASRRYDSEKDSRVARGIYGTSQSRLSSSSLSSSESDENFTPEKDNSREPERSKSEQLLDIRVSEKSDEITQMPRLQKAKGSSSKDKTPLSQRSQSQQNLTAPYTPIVTESMEWGEYEEKLRTTERLNPTVALPSSEAKKKLAEKKRARKSFATVKSKGGDEGKKTELTDCMMMGIRGAVKATVRAMAHVVDVTERERAHPEEFDMSFCNTLPFPAAGTKSEGGKILPPTPPPSSSSTNDFTPTKDSKVTVTPKHSYKDFEFKEYFGTVFARLRTRWGISSSGYLKSVATRSAPYHDFIPNSKSGNLFFLTRDAKYMLKSQTTSETKFLRRILKQYYQHMMEHPGSLLSRIAGMYRLTSPRYGQVHFIVMTNVFYAKRTIHLRFDLKGSTYGRNATEDEKKSKNPVFKDLDLMEMQTKLKLAPQDSEAFLEACRSDSKFLASLEIMDYSLLLGIHYKNRQTFEEEDDTHEKFTEERLTPGLQVQVRNHRDTVIKEEEDRDSDFEAEEGDDFYRNEDAKVEPLRGLSMHSDGDPSETNDPGPLTRASSTSALGDDGLSGGGSMNNEDADAGQFSGDGTEVYYMGIIDILQQFNIRKKGEALYKTTLRDSMSQSCVEPQLYASRFHGFISKHVQPTLPSSGATPTPGGDADSVTPPRRMTNSTSSPQLLSKEKVKTHEKMLRERQPDRSGVISPHRARSDSTTAASSSALLSPPSRHYVASSLPKNFTLGSSK